MKISTQRLGTFVLLVLAVVPLLFWLDAEFFNQALAGSGPGDVFQKGEDKGNQIADALKGKIAITITGLSVAFCAVMALMSRMNYLTAVRIIVASLVLSSCMEIAAFLYA